MKLPLIILSACTLIVGFIPFSHFISADGKSFDAEVPWTFSIHPVGVALIGIIVAYVLYYKQNNRAEKISSALGGVYRAAYSKFYIDEIYLFLTKKIVFNLVGRPSAWIDRNIVDGTMNGIAWSTAKVSSTIKGLQSGRVQSYAIFFFSGIVLMVIIFLYWWK